MIAERTISQQGARRGQAGFSCFNQTVSGRGWPTDKVSIHASSNQLNTIANSHNLRRVSVKNTDYNQEVMILKEIQKEMANAKVQIPNMRNHPNYRSNPTNSNSLKEVRKQQQQQIKEMVSAKTIKKQPFSQVAAAQPYRISVPKTKAKAEGDKQSSTYDPLSSKNWNSISNSTKTNQWHSMIQKIKSAAARYKKMTKNSAFLINRVNIDEHTRTSTRQKSRKWFQQVHFTTKPVDRQLRTQSRRPERATSVEEGRGREGTGPDPWNIQDSNVFECEDMGV